MWEQLPRLVQEAMADEAIRVLILSSATPGLFCAGADIHEFARCSGDEEWRVANQAAIRATQYALAHAEKPVIAAIDGDAVGGGCGLAIARSEEHTSALQSLMRKSYAVFCLKKKKTKHTAY